LKLTEAKIRQIVVIDTSMLGYINITLG
jgi:hypothetical protein